MRTVAGKPLKSSFSDFFISHEVTVFIFPNFLERESKTSEKALNDHEIWTRRSVKRDKQTYRE